MQLARLKRPCDPKCSAARGSEGEQNHSANVGVAHADTRRSKPVEIRELLGSRPATNNLQSVRSSG